MLVCDCLVACDLTQVLTSRRASGSGGGVLASVWVFEYAPQNGSFSLIPGRDDAFLRKLQAANQVLAESAGMGWR